MNSDFNLFFYGMFAKLISFSGGFIAFIGCLVLAFGSYWGILIILLGGGIVIYSNAMRFSYRRQSGHIIYNGGSY